MINCNCHRAQTLTKCAGSLTIGSISATDADIYVYFQDLGTGRIDREESTTDGNGNIVLSPSFNFMPRDYHIWVTKKNANYFTDYEKITIDGNADTHDCIEVDFAKTYSGANLVNMDQTLTSNG